MLDDGLLTELVGLCAGKHSYSEFMSTMAVESRALEPHVTSHSVDQGLDFQKVVRTCL